MPMSLPSVVFWFVVSVLFMGALRIGLLAVFLWRRRFETGRLETLQLQKMPKAIRQLLDLAVPRLDALGFQRSMSMVTWGGGLNWRNRPAFCDVYYSASAHCHAWIYLATEPEPGALYVAEFETCYADGCSLLTANPRVQLLSSHSGEIVSHEGHFVSIEEQWQLHMRRRSEILNQEIVADPAEAWRRRQKRLTGQPALLEKSGYLRSGPIAGHWRLTLRGAATLFLRLAPLSRNGAFSRPASRAENISSRALADVVAFNRSLRASTSAPHDWPIKMLLVMGSALLGTQSLGLQWSWRSAAALVFVLAFHESCHLVAMRLSGYREIGVLSVPMVDTAARVTKETATLWQRLFVYLSAPLSGAIFGVGCVEAAAHVDSLPASWLLPLGAVALGVNLFDLLPFPPLDGGRILEALMWQYKPRLRPMLLGSAVVALGATGFYEHLASAMALAAGFALAVPAELRVSKLAAATRRNGVEGYERRGALRAVFLTLMQSGVGAKLGFSRRTELASTVLSRVIWRAPHPTQAVTAGIIYAIVLVAPVTAYLAADAANHDVMQAQSVGDHGPRGAPARFSGNRW